MSRIQPVSQPQPSAAPTLATLQRTLGMVPNLYATLAHSPALLNGFLAFADALGKGRLTAPQRELLALAIGQANACQYCLSAHTLLAGKAGFSAQEIRAARLGQAADPSITPCCSWQRRWSASVGSSVTSSWRAPAPPVWTTSCCWRCSDRWWSIP